MSGPLRIAACALFLFFAARISVVAQEREELTIGNVECLSGLHAKAGEQAVAGIRACVDWVNAKHGGVAIGGRKLPLKYLVYDCESNREAVGSLLERLITVDRVDAVIAPYTSGLTLAGAPVAEKYSMVYLDHGGASDEIFEQGFKWIVQTIGPGSKYHVGTLDMLHAHAPEAKRLALIYEDSENPRAVKQGAEEHARKLGYEIVFNQTYPPGVTDLTPLLSAMKATSPDVVISGGHLEDGQLITRQMADLGINVQAMSLISAATIPAFHDALGEKANGVMGPSHWEIGVTYSPATAQAEGLPWIGPSQAEFVELFHKHGGAKLEPDYHAGEAGAAVLAWVMAVERAGIAKPVDVRRALGELKFMSFYGAWGIDETGLQVGHPMVDVQWQHGERVIVWPAAAKTAELLYPLRTSTASSGGPQSFAAQIAGNVIQGLVLGAIYGVATMGLSLIFGVLRIVNVSHGALIMVGAFAAWWVTAILKISPLVAVPLALVLGAIIGLIFYYTALKKLLKAPELASLLATFALGVVLEEVVKHTFTSESRGYAWDIGSLDLGVTTLPVRSLLAAIGSAGIALGIYLWFTRTRLGSATRAVVQDDLGAAVCGVNVQRIYAMVFAMGTSLTVMSGVLVSMHNPGGIAPGMGHAYTLRAFVIAVLGGLTSPYGAFFAGLLFGVMENGSYLLLAQIPGIEPIAAARFLSFVMLLVILLVRPTGLLGAK